MNQQIPPVRRTVLWRQAMIAARVAGVSPARLAELREDSTLAEVRAETAAARENGATA